VSDALEIQRVYVILEQPDCAVQPVTLSMKAIQMVPAPKAVQPAERALQVLNVITPRRRYGAFYETPVLALIRLGIRVLFYDGNVAREQKLYDPRSKVEKSFLVFVTALRQSHIRRCQS
jgi:hypothetical protein